MDPSAEALIRSTLHDLANCLSGVRGILDLSDPGQPLSPRDRERLDAVLEDGMGTLTRARHLAMGTFPEGLAESGRDWRDQLHHQLRPMGTLFRCGFEFTHAGDPDLDRWPGEALRSLVVALVRQILPYRQEGPLRLAFHADAERWSVLISPAPGIPEGLKPEAAGRPSDLSVRWIHRLVAELGGSLAEAEGGVSLRLPRM